MRQKWSTIDRRADIYGTISHRTAAECSGWDQLVGDRFSPLPRRHDVLLTDDELDRYSRQIGPGVLTREGQERSRVSPWAICPYLL